MSKKPAPDDPKKLLRCPGGCGNAVNFIMLAKCARCGKVRCDVCMRRFRKKPHCKGCARERQSEESRLSTTKR